MTPRQNSISEIIYLRYESSKPFPIEKFAQRKIKKLTVNRLDSIQRKVFGEHFKCLYMTALMSKLRINHGLHRNRVLTVFAEFFDSFLRALEKIKKKKKRLL